MKKKLFTAFVSAAAIALTGTGGSVCVRADGARSLYRADTVVTLPPAVVQEIDTKQEYDALVSAVEEDAPRPQIALFYPDAALNANGIAVSQIVNDLGGGVLPAFYMRNEAIANAFSAYAQTSALYDAYVVASEPEIVASVKEQAGELYGVLDVRESRLTPSQTIAEVNRCGARTAWIENKSKRETEYLQYRSVCVWASGSLDAVVTGANGVVTDSVKEVVDFLEGLPAGALLRNPMIVGHRGLETKKLENSLSGLRAAFAAGADAVECDFQVSKDDRLVVMHDDTLERTTNGTGSIKDKSWNEIKDCLIDYPKAAKDTEPVPLLDDFFAEIKQNGKMLVVEIKSADERSVPLLKELVDKYGVSDQIILISYFAKQMERARELLPEIAVGDLNFMPKSASLEKIVKDAAKRGVTFSPVWSEVNAEIGYELFMRGFGMGCWTYRTAAELANGYASCWHSLTVNDASLSSDFIEGAEGALALYSNRAVQPKISAVTLADGKAEKEVKIISADFEYSLSENGIMAAANGTYTATVSISFSGCGKNLYIFEQVPVTVASYSEETAPPETPDLPQEPKYPGDQNGGGETSNGEKASENNLGLVIGLSVAAGVIAVAGVACGVTLALCKRKK